MTLIVAVDFDGTIVEHEFPEIGKPVPGAFDCLKEMQSLGVRLILWTMRSDGQKNGPVLTQAVEFCKANGIVFWGVNENPEQKSWTTSPKVYAHVYIDDAAHGCELVVNPRMDGRPFVNWSSVRDQIIKPLQS